MTEENQGLSRRTLVKGAAWSVPVVVAAVAAPAQAASVVNVGDFSLNGQCAVLGLLGRGFALTAGAVDLPIGTRVTISRTGIANIGLFDIEGGTASVQALSTTSVEFTLNAPLSAGATMAFRSLLSVSVVVTLTAVAALPTGYVAGTGAKTTGSVNVTLILCGAN